MWQYIALISIGINLSLIAYFKFKNPDIVNVQGDQINDPKIKDNRKIKNRKGLFRRIFKTKEERLASKNLRKNK